MFYLQQNGLIATTCEGAGPTGLVHLQQAGAAVAYKPHSHSCKIPILPVTMVAA